MTSVVLRFAAGNASLLNAASFLSALEFLTIIGSFPPSPRALEGRVPAMASKSFAAGYVLVAPAEHRVPLASPLRTGIDQIPPYKTNLPPRASEARQKPQLL